MSGIAFAAPWLLAAAAALAIPVLVHLVRHEDRAGRAFPSLMFLHRVPFSARARRRLRDHALLALRALALLALVIAFAGPHPVFEGGGPAPARDTVVLLDVSASMSVGERFAGARREARSALEDAAAGGRVALVTFDSGPRIRADLEAGAEAARGALEAAAPGHGGTDLARALDAAARLLAAGRAGERRVVLVSDLQASALRTDPRLPRDVDLELRPVGAAPPPANLALVGAWLDPGADGPGGRVGLRVRVANTGGAAARSPLRVTVDGLAAGEQPVSLAPGGQADLAVPVFPAADRPTRVRLSLEADALAADDARFLVVAPPPAVVLLAVGADGAAPHLDAALAVARGPRLRVERVAPGDLDAARLADAALVVLSGATLDAPAAAALDRWVAGGGGLLQFAGAGDAAAGAVTAGVPGAVVDADTAFAPPDRAGPLAPAPGDAGLAGIAVWRYRRLDPAPGDQVLARYEDGAPAILARQHGDGRSLTVTTAPDPGWSALPLDPAFPPLLLESLAWLSGRGAAPLDHPPGSVVDAAALAAGIAGGEALAAALAAGETLLVRAPSGRERRLAADQPVRLDEAGFHELRAGGSPALPVAVSAGGEESDLRALAAEEFLGRLERDPPAAAPLPADPEAGRDERLARALLALAAGLLLAEGALAGWLAQRRAARAEPA